MLPTIALLLLQAVYAPSLTTGQVVIKYEGALAALTNNLNQQLNQTVWNSVAAGTNTTLTVADRASVNASLSGTATSIQALTKGQSQCCRWASARPPMAGTGRPCLCASLHGLQLCSSAAVSTPIDRPLWLMPAPPCPTAGQPDKYLELLYDALAVYQSNTVFSAAVCNASTSCAQPQLLPSGVRPRNVATLP
jgi:hypothetical protein